LAGVEPGSSCTGIFIVTHSTHDVCRYAAPATPTASQQAETDYAREDSCARPTNTLLGMTDRYEYKVIQLREGLLGGKMSGDKLEKVLNEHASQGWQLKAITAAEVKGRVGPGGVEGVLVTFERRWPDERH